MLGQLMAEEELVARSAAVHPHLEVKDQRDIISRLSRHAGVVETPQKPTRADLAGIGIKDVTGES